VHNRTLLTNSKWWKDFNSYNLYQSNAWEKMLKYLPQCQLSLGLIDTQSSCSVVHWCRHHFQCEVSITSRSTTNKLIVHLAAWKLFSMASLKHMSDTGCHTKTPMTHLAACNSFFIYWHYQSTTFMFSAILVWQCYTSSGRISQQTVVLSCSCCTMDNVKEL